MCYYELPTVQREIGYDPAPYIAAVSRRRLDSYGPDIAAGEAAVTARAGTMIMGQNGRYFAKTRPMIMKPRAWRGPAGAD